MKKIKGKLKKIAAIFMAAIMCLTAFSLPSFASAENKDYTLIELLNWLSSDECTIDLTSTQKSDVSKALSLYNTYSSCFDLSDDDDAAYLDNVLKSLDQIDTLSDLVTTDENFTGYNAFYTNFTMLTGSAYTANVSIDAIAHVSKYSSFSSSEGLAWGSSNPSAGWYTKEKGYFDTYRDSLGYSAPLTYGGDKYKAIVNAAYDAGKETGHYTNLFYCGTTQLIGVGYTTEKGDAGYSKTWSYNTSTTTASKSGGVTYSTSEIRTIIYAYICEEINGGHSYTNEITTEATCTEDGVMTYTCSVCGTTKTEAIEAAGHSYDYENITWEWADDYSSATAVVTCSNDSSHTLTYDATVTTQTTEGTCTEDGVVTYTASITLDDETYTNTKTVTIKATGHSYDDGVVTTAASCTTDGVMTYTCSVCGDTYTETIPATGHTFGDWTTVSSSTCTGTGSRSRTCSVCGYTEYEDLDATGHTWEEDYTVDVEATCTTDGSKSIHCSQCDATKDSTVISATGHSYTGETTAEATCTEEGVITYTCSVCGDTYTAAIGAAGHSYAGEVTTAATCTEEGVMTYTCSVCGDTYTEAIEATGHSYAGEVTTAATCTEEGVMTYTCSVCGDTYTEAIATTEHSYEGVVTLEATETEDGVITYTCSVCGDTYTEAIAATGSANSTGSILSDVADEITENAQTIAEAGSSASSGSSDGSTSGSDSSDDSSESSSSSGSNASGTSNAPTTGQNMNMAVWAICLASAGALLIAMLAIYKKKKNNI